MPSGPPPRRRPGTSCSPRTPTGTAWWRCCRRRSPRAGSRPTELEQRTGAALSARTYGELDDVLHGLGGLPRAVRSHPVRKVVFWVATVLCSPFVLLGTLLFAFGSDVGDHVGGFIFLAALLPALFLLQRWAWPRPRRLSGR